MYKGHNRVFDEIKRHDDSRYAHAPQEMWRILCDDIHHISHPACSSSLRTKRYT